MSSSSSIGDFDLNAVKIRKTLEFPDGTTQQSAYTGLPAKIYTNYNQLEYKLTQPNWSQVVQTFNNLPIGIYQMTVYYTLYNADTKDVDFDYLEIVVKQNPGVTLQQKRNADFTVKHGDDLSDVAVFTFANPATSNIQLQLVSAITSGNFQNFQPEFFINNIILIKLFDTI